MNASQQVALFTAGFEHKHYLGEAKEFEEFEQFDGLGKGFFIKVFFINTKVNLNKWQVTWDAIEQDIKDVVGVPIVLQDDMRHPNFMVQNIFAKGYIVDFVLDKKKGEASVIIRILDPSTIKLIKDGKLKYVSPAIVARSNLDIETLSSGVDLLSRFIALHLALVSEPAYGKEDAHIHGMCTGTGQTCNAKLRQMSAAVIHELIHVGDCVSEKIPILLKEDPSMTQDQAVAIAISMCKEKDGKKYSDAPLERKLLASVNRLSSEFDMMTRFAVHPEFGGKVGYWMNVQDLDIFVANGQMVDEAINAQCGCQLNGARRKASKEEVNYQYATSPAKLCNNCRFFNESANSCDVVEGFIELGHISDSWQDKISDSINTTDN